MTLPFLTSRRRDALPLLLAGCAIVLAASFLARSSFAQEDAQIRWKSVEMAQVRLDGKAPLKWNVYQPDKRSKGDKKRNADIALVLLGHRYLMLNLRSRLVYLVPLSELHADGLDFLSSDLAQQARVIPSTDWTDRDVGPAQIYRLTLGDYNHVMELSLPHMPDLRPFY